MIGLVIGIGVGAVILGLTGAYRHHENSASTIEERERVVLKRLTEKYRGQGASYPAQAAADHIYNMSKIEEFRQQACAEYVRSGTSLSEMKAERIKAYNQATRKVYGDSAEGKRLARTFEIALMATPACEIFTSPEAKAKWQAELKAAMVVDISQDTYRDHAIERMFAAGNKI